MPTRLLCPWGFFRKESWSGFLSSRGSSQGSNPGLPHCNLPSQKLEVGPEICFHQPFIWFKCMFNALIRSLQSPLSIIITVVLPGNPRCVLLVPTVHLRILEVPKDVISRVQFQAACLCGTAHFLWVRCVSHHVLMWSPWDPRTLKRKKRHLCPLYSEHSCAPWQATGQTFKVITCMTLTAMRKYIQNNSSDFSWKPVRVSQ